MKRGLSLCLAAALLVVGAGCSKAGTGPTALTGVLRIALPINPDQLNPLLAQNTNESFLDGLIFDELVTLDNHGNEVPDLAALVPTLENGGISKDGKTITYHLRHGVKWHDGAPFSSADVKFTWQAIMNPNNNVISRGPYSLISRVDTPDAYTVVFHFKQLYPPAVDTIFGESDTPYRIIPKHLLAQYPNINQIPFNASPIGTGPFKFVRWMRGDEIVLAANANYFLGKPKLHQIVVKIVTDDNTVLAELRSHELDMAFELNATSYHALQNVPGLTLTVVPSPEWEGMNFNTQRPPLNDPTVRRAIALAVDKQTLAVKNEYGTAQLATADLSPFYWAYDRTLKPTGYDLASATRMLDADGWRVGSGGIRVKNGQQLSLQFTYGQGSVLGRNVAEEVQQDLVKLGVEVSLKSYSYTVLFESAQDGGIYNSGKFDIAFYAWVPGGDPDNSSQWASNEIPPAGNNIARYQSAEMDADQKLALSTFDRATRKAAYAKIQALLLHDAPGVFFFYPNEKYAYVPTFTGFTPNGISEGWNAYQWDN